MFINKLILNNELSDSFISELSQGLEDLEIKNFTLNDLSFDVDNLIEYIFDNPSFQNINSSVYKLIKNLLILRYAIHYKFSDSVDKILGVPVDFPYLELGVINSRHFFGIDELLIYCFYKRNIGNYKKVCDIGTNVGLHSKIMCQLGYEVHSYEPDTDHSIIAKKYLAEFPNNSFHQSAVSSYNGKANFTRIINNTTGSYINDKKESYGPTLKYEVKVIDAASLAGNFDLFKIDVEGSEVDILSRFNREDFKKADFIAEISTPKTREYLWDIFSSIDVPIYSQKNSWNKVEHIESLPTSHREGIIFISYNKTWCGNKL